MSARGVVVLALLAIALLLMVVRLWLTLVTRD